MDRFLGYVSNEGAERWLKRIREGVRKLAVGKAWSHRLVTRFGFWIPLPGQKGGTRRLVKGKRGTSVVLYGSTPGHIEPTAPDVLHFTRTLGDEMDLQVCETLAAVGNRLRRCPRCGRLFVQVKRQRYCSRQCASALRSQTYRARHRRPLSAGTDSLA